MSEPKASHGGDGPGEPAIMQRHHELSRLVAEGRRADDGSTCSLVLLRKTGGDWLLHPHGVAELGVRLSDSEARRVAQTILDGGR